MIEYTYVPASQIQPVSGFEVQKLSIDEVKKEVEQYFFSKGQLPYKIYKNAYTQSLGSSPTPEAFVSDFFDVLENSLKLQLKETERDGNIALKEAFEILRNTFKLLSKSNVKFEPLTFFGTIVAFILSRLK